MSPELIALLCNADRRQYGGIILKARTYTLHDCMTAHERNQTR